MFAPLALTQVALPALQADRRRHRRLRHLRRRGRGLRRLGRVRLGESRPGSHRRRPRRRAPGDAGVRVRSRRHAHRDAPGRLPRRGHLRPARSRETVVPACCGCSTSARQRPLPRRGRCSPRPDDSGRDTRDHPAARARRDRATRAAGAGPGRGPAAGRRAGPDGPHTRFRELRRSCSRRPDGGEHLGHPGRRRGRPAGRRPAGHGARLPPRSPDGDDWVVELRTPRRGRTRSTMPRAGRTAPAAARRDGRAAGRPPGPVPRVGSRLWLAHVPVEGGVPGGWSGYGRPISYGDLRDRWPLAAYQTVFADEPGSAEMPSAGRPFTAELCSPSRSPRRGRRADLTLHTGVSSPEAGEPPPAEWYRGPGRHRAAGERRPAPRGGRVIAVGTTVDPGAGDAQPKRADGSPRPRLDRAGARTRTARRASSTG